MGPQLRPAMTLTEGGSLQRQDFVAAAVRLPDGDPWKEKFLKELRINPRGEETPRQWIHKANTENFRKWLQAPEGSAPFDFGKIFKSLGYSIDISQRDLPPAVPSMLIAMVLAEAQSKEEINRAAKWFLEVAKEGFRFRHAHQFLLLRRAMEIRRATSSSWDGADIWRAREDHTLVALGSKVKLENRLDRPDYRDNPKEGPSANRSLNH